MIRGILLAATVGGLAASAAVAQTASPTETRTVTAPGPFVTTGSGQRYSRHGTVIVTGSGRTVSIGARRAGPGLRPVSATPHPTATGK